MNAVEKYSCNESKTKISIDFTYSNTNAPQKTYSLPQKGWVRQDKGNGARWKVSPLWPLKMPYEIIELDEKDYKYCVIGYPSRDYFWIMSRSPKLDEGTHKEMLDRLVVKHGYDLEGSFRVRQEWGDREYARKRGVEKETKGFA